MTRREIEARRQRDFPNEHWGHEALEIHSETPELNRWYFEQLAGPIRGNVLEVGAGIGNISAHIVESCESLCVSDMDPHHIDALERRFASRDDVTVVRYELGGEVPEVIAQQRFDAIVSLNVLEHVEDDLAAVRTLVDRLEEGGHLLTYVPALDWAYGTMDRHLLHYRRYDLGTFDALMRGAGLEVERIHYLNALGIFGWFLNGRILSRTSPSSNQTRLFDRLVPFLRRLEPETPPIGLGLICHAKKVTR